MPGPSGVMGRAAEGGEEVSEGGRGEGRRECEGCTKGRTAQAPAGPGRLKVRLRDSEEVPGMGAAWRRAGKDSGEF